MRLLQLAFLVALASGIAAILIYMTGVSNLDGPFHLSSDDLEALASLQSHFQKCVSANGLGLRAERGSDDCEVSLKFSSDTVPKWKDPKTGELEGLSFKFNLCEAVATWEQVRNSTTILTKEYIDTLPNGCEEYAWRRINKGVLLNQCKNRTLCLEKLSLNFTEYVGTKSTFRLLNRGSAKALDKVAELYERGKEVLIVKTTIHDIMNKMIREVPILNPVYLMLGASFGSAAKGTGLKALEFALSMCDTVDMYGFTVDPESRQGHTPLQGRAYYQMMECLGLIKIHSPMRVDPNRVVKWVPSPSLITAARIAADKFLRRVGAGSSDPLAACSIIGKQKLERVFGSRKAAVEHQKYVRGATMYPLEHHPCMANSAHFLPDKICITSHNNIELATFDLAQTWWFFRCNFGDPLIAHGVNLSNGLNLYT
ncbi:hypothetical protein ACS0TY_023945 [Phlomoides rotata]